MRASGLLLLRGIRWRLGLSLLTVLTSAIAVGAAVLGPLYLQTAGDSVVRSTVQSAPVENRGATLSAYPGQPTSVGHLDRAEQLVEQAGGSHRWFGKPITSIVSGLALVGPRSGLVRSQLLARTGICTVLRFRAGGCNLALGDVAISDRSARELGVSLGDVVGASVAGATKPVPLKITGIYAAPNPDLSYWWGNAASYFPFGQVTGGPRSAPEIDSLVASPATALDVPARDVPDITGQLPLRLASVSLGQERSLRSVVSRDTAATADRRLALTTQLPSLLASADRQRHAMGTIVAVAAVQLVLLAIWVLAGLLVRSSDAREAEIRVARLRGFPAASLFGVTALEPATLCAVGLLLGIAAAWGTVAVAKGQLLNRAAVISPDGWVFVALGVSVAAIALALGRSSIRLLRAGGLSEAPATVRSRSSRTSLITDTVLLVLAVVALVALASNGSLSGHSNPIASAAPGLIALGIAVLAVQLVLFACRIGVSSSANSDRIAIFLALRGIVRRPTVMRQTRVLIIALCLACFAISAWSVARTNRAAAASFSVGTREVVAVTPNGVGLQQAVDRVDPKGRFAMAAVSVVTPSSTLVAVDARRLAAVMSWPRGISDSTLAATGRRLDPPTVPAVNLPAGPVRLAALTTSTNHEAPRNLEVALWVSNPQAGTGIVDLGLLHRGRWTYQGNLANACQGGCRLAGLGLVPAVGRNAPSSGIVRITVTRLSALSGPAVWKPIGGDLVPHGWRATAPGIEVQSRGGGGLTFVVPAAATSSYTGAVGFATPPMAAPADHPTVIPGAVTTEVQSLNGGSRSGGVVPAQGLDGTTLSVSSAVTASALPRLGDNAVMVDLDLLSRAQSGPTSPYAADQVWLGPAAPADAVARLRMAGLRIDRVQTASAVFAQLQRSAPALADDFLLVATIVALFAAAVSTLGALGANTRQRATELTALEVSGVSRRVLAGSLALESGVLALTALFGAGAGVLAAIIAIPSLPELGTPALIPLQYGLPGGLVVAVTAAVVAVILIATAAVVVALVGRMSPTLLRMAPNDSAG